MVDEISNSIFVRLPSFSKEEVSQVGSSASRVQPPISSPVDTAEMSIKDSDDKGIREEQTSVETKASNSAVVVKTNKIMKRYQEGESATQWYQDLRDMGTTLAGFFVGGVVGGMGGVGIDGLGMYKGASLGSAVGLAAAGTAVKVDELDVSDEVKAAAILSVGGFLAGLSGMFLTRYGVIGVSEAVGAGVAASMATLCMTERDDRSGFLKIAGASLAGAVAGASGATWVVAGAAIGAVISTLAKAAQFGFGKVRIFHTGSGMVAGGLIGAIYEASGVLGESASFEIIKEASFAGAGLGAVVGAFFVEKRRQEKVAKERQDGTSMTALAVGLNIGAAAGIGGCTINLACRYIVPWNG